MEASFRLCLSYQKASRANGTDLPAEGGGRDAHRRFAAVSQDEHDSITCSSRLTFILNPANERSPPFSLYCFSPYKAVAALRCRTSPSLWPGGAPLSPGRSVFRRRTTLANALGSSHCGRLSSRLTVLGKRVNSLTKVLLFTNRYAGAPRFTKRARPRHTMSANVSYTDTCKRKAPLLLVCLCLPPKKQSDAQASHHPSLWPGGAPLSPGQSFPGTEMHRPLPRVYTKRTRVFHLKHLYAQESAILRQGS